MTIAVHPIDADGDSWLIRPMLTGWKKLPVRQAKPVNVLVAAGSGAWAATAYGPVNLVCCFLFCCEWGGVLDLRILLC